MKTIDAHYFDQPINIPNIRAIELVVVNTDKTDLIDSLPGFLINCFKPSGSVGNSRWYASRESIST
jgi:hypothetical protein